VALPPGTSDNRVVTPDWVAEAVENLAQVIAEAASD
jgi:hypothetical protein